MPFSRPALLALCLALGACAPAAAFDPTTLPAAADLGPKPAQTEWWYVSGYLPESGVAFHWAQFKVNYQGIAYYASNLAVTDLRAGRLDFHEQNSGEGVFRFPPLLVGQGEWKLAQRGAAYSLSAGPLAVELTPSKPPVVHPPGYSGAPEVGRLYYQSITRLTVRGTVSGREVQGLAWLDHQWGDQVPAQSAVWDWFGLHLSNGVDLMVYRVRNRAGQVVQLVGSWVDAQGRARPVHELSAAPQGSWRSPSGRDYAVFWALRADEFRLALAPVRQNQELLSRTTLVAYWEGPMTGTGEWQGESVQAQGMGEFVAGSLFR